MNSPVCSVCDDTHRMYLGDREVMCTRCPSPCQLCRAGGNGPYCEHTPCSCECHTYNHFHPSKLTDEELRGTYAKAAIEEMGGKSPHTWGMVRRALEELKDLRNNKRK